MLPTESRITVTIGIGSRLSRVLPLTTHSFLLVTPYLHGIDDLYHHVKHRAKRNQPKPCSPSPQWDDYQGTH